MTTCVQCKEDIKKVGYLLGTSENTIAIYVCMKPTCSLFCLTQVSLVEVRMCEGCGEECEDKDLCGKCEVEK